MTSFVVGIDASQDAHDALDWALATAGEADGVIAVHAWEIPVTTGYETVAVVDTTAIEEAAKEFLTAEVTGRADQRLSGRLVTGHPGRAITDVAEEARDQVGDGAADVTVVVGHAGSGKVGLLLGSTANYVVRHARAAAVVVRGEVRLPVRRIVVGVDDPHEDHPDGPSLAALRWAVGLSGVDRIEVHHAAFVPGVAAGPLSQPGVESEEEITDLDRQLRDAIAEAIGGVVPESGAEIVPVITGGTAGFALIEASREADLIVIGTRGHSGLRDLITGSTSLEVTAHAHCPVAVIR